MTHMFLQLSELIEVLNLQLWANVFVLSVIDFRIIIAQKILKKVPMNPEHYIQAVGFILSRALDEETDMDRIIEFYLEA